MFDPYWRRRALADLADPFDLVVIGAGITGAGIFLDAAQRGLRVLMVDQGDVASGTSSRSSKLIHGGLRYLKQMQFRITRLACRERDRLLALSPHLVEPVSFLYPAYEGDRTPGWQVDLGLWMYDRLTQRPNKHRHLDSAEVQRLIPGLETEELDRALLYGDARTDDARLTLAVAATGAAYGGLLLTCARLEEGVRNRQDRVAGVVVRDLLDGNLHRVEARVVVNSTGHWVDAVRERFGLHGRRVKPSRGAHLIFGRQRLPLEAAITVSAPDDGRPVFLVPHPEGVLVGTTDLYHEGSLDDPRPTRSEVGYLLRAVQSVFPGRGVGAGDVVGAWAGLRPILDSHAEDPTEASREEDIWEEEGLLSVAGGKLTTYRVTAEEAVDRVEEALPEERTRELAPCATSGTPLAGLAPPDQPWRLVASGRVEEPVATAMTRRLGSRAWYALELARGRRELQPLLPESDLCAAEVRAHLTLGAVCHLEDLLLRRVRVGMWQPEVARELSRSLRPYCSTHLGWSRKRWEDEEEGFLGALTAWTPDGVVEG